MLKDGTDGNSKAQIEKLLENYVPSKYQNNKNMSFANALFIRNTFKNDINKTYMDELKDKYNAEIMYDSTEKNNTINNWVSNKTSQLIPNIIDSVDDADFILTNALAIDMEWVNKIQKDGDYEDWGVLYN